MWRAASPAFSVPAQWPSRVAGVRGVDGGGVGVWAIDWRGERARMSASKENASRESRSGTFPEAEIVGTFGAPRCATTSGVWW